MNFQSIFFPNLGQFITLTRTNIATRIRIGTQLVSTLRKKRTMILKNAVNLNRTHSNYKL